MSDVEKTSHFSAEERAQINWLLQFLVRVLGAIIVAAAVVTFLITVLR